MNIHKNARLTPKGREILVRRMLEEGLRVEEAAQASGVSVRTACKWRARYRAQGLAGLQDSRPHHTPHRTGEGCRAIQACEYQTPGYPCCGSSVRLSAATSCTWISSGSGDSGAPDTG